MKGKIIIIGLVVFVLTIVISCIVIDLKFDYDKEYIYKANELVDKQISGEYVNKMIHKSILLDKPIHYYIKAIPTILVILFFFEMFVIAGYLGWKHR